MIGQAIAPATSAAGDAAIAAQPAVPSAPSLRSGFAWTLAGNVVYAACQWGQLVLLAKAGAAAMVGVFSLGLAVTGPPVQFAMLNLRGVQVSDVATGRFRFADFLVLRLWTMLLAVLGVAAFVMGTESSGETRAVILWVLVAKSLEAIADVFHGLFHQRERMELPARSLVARGVLSLAAMAVALRWEYGLTGASAAIAAAGLVVLLGFDVPAAIRLLRLEPGRRVRRRVSIADQRALLVVAAPLGMVMLLGSLNANLPRYFIAAHSGEEALGVFSALAYLLVAGATLITALGQAAGPRLARALAVGDSDGARRLVRRLTLVAVALGMVGVALATAAGPQIVAMLYTPEFAREHLSLVLMALAGLASFVSSALGYSLTAAGAFRVQVPLGLLLAISLLALSWLLVPRWGVTGAAAALGLSYLLQLPPKHLLLRRALASRSTPVLGAAR